jgi:hypothetical protein
MNETTLPRTFAAILLLVSLAMLIPLGVAVAALLRGDPVEPLQWTVPLVVLATGATLIHLISRRGGVPQQRLFLPALALWLLAAGYFLYAIV